MPSVAISMSFPMEGEGIELLEFLMRDEGFDPTSAKDRAEFTGVFVRNCLIKYKNVCQIIDEHELDVFMENIDKIKLSETPRGHVWVLLNEDLEATT